LYKAADPDYNGSGVETYASALRARYATEVVPGVLVAEAEPENDGTARTPRNGPDPFRDSQRRAIDELAKNEAFIEAIGSNGIPWGVVIGMLKEALPSTLTDRDSIAYNLVPTAMNTILGQKDKAWTTERRGPKATLFIRKL
jgi:hypothetical protein